MVCGKFREEMWEKKKRNLGEFLSNLCQGLAVCGTTICMGSSITVASIMLKSLRDVGSSYHGYYHIVPKANDHCGKKS